ncbi:S-adenosyl-L-methionine-dependent methyltransferase [Parathielavia appendiculata]|uniref:S-adenosyl-L-methionine-dependent methyltransferase n=1 Tax=Parathielavia appendiculata TaxID=2587402 RepID=A0AAN6TV63_9PEZI|nr:S-adenosyl-L-methionine-dependent methyltransferase [Parathielavia appendiculata]
MLQLLPLPLAALLEPFHFMGSAASYLPSTVMSLILARDFGTLLSWPRLQAAWFGRFWARVGPDVRANAEKNVIPLVQGRVQAGHIHPPPSDNETGTRTAHPPVSGTVLEVGPGSGMWTSLFSPRYLPRITKVYGVEPNPAQHAGLKRQIAAAELDDGAYEIVPVGIEDLAASGRVPRESVDCIVTVMCLCSIPEPEHNVKQLYGYLKPGGRWYVYEHVKCFKEQGWGMGLYQALLNLFWPQFIGGCEMCRETGKWIKGAGAWSEVDLCQLDGEPWYFTMPHIIGVLTK